MDGSSGATQTLIVVGNGMMGFRLCRRLVECGATPEALRLVVFGEEPRPAYDRVRVTELLAGGTEEDLRLAPADWYRDHGIELHLGDPVAHIDRAECAVRSASGAMVPFDRLVLATGSRPFVPPIPGAALEAVFVYRTVDDLRAILHHARDAGGAAIVGGGLIGLEAASAVRALGPEVHLIEPSRGLLPRQLDATGAELLREAMEAHGVAVHTGARTIRIEADGARRVVCLDDGGRVTVDLVVLAAGIRPRGELARESGLETAGSGGVVVDDHLQSSDPRIFAVGECATHRGVTYGLLAPGYRMIDVLVDNLVGGSAAFEGADRSARLKLPGLSVAAVGRYEEAVDTQTQTYLAGGVYRKLVLREGRIVGALAVGEWADLPRVCDALEEPRRFSFWDLRRFRSTGSLWQKTESPPVYEWPAEALVCGCLGVRRGTLTEAELDGCETADELSARTGAGTACGSCRPLLVELMQHARVESMPPSRLRALALTRRGPPSERDASEPPPTLRCSALPPSPEDADPGSTRTAIFPEACSDLGAPASERPPESEPRWAPREFPTLPSIDVLSLRAPLPASLCPPSSRPRPVAERSSDAEGWGVPAGKRPPTVADSGAPSSRRESLAPLRPLSVPSRRISGLLLPPSVPPAREESTQSPLLGTAVAALAGVAAFTLAPAVPPARSLRGASPDVLWTARAPRQASGYGVVVLSLATLVLSLRKRWKPFSRGSVAGLRVVHGALGVAALACLALHTGLHAGERLNRVLAADFLAVAALGAIAAAATARGDAAAGPGPRLVLTRAHLLLLLPLPVLLALHVLGAYYF